VTGYVKPDRGLEMTATQ